MNTIMLNSCNGIKVIIVGFCVIITLTVATKYEPNWASLDTRPIPEWYDEAKIGIFMHWGVYSVASYGSEWFWYYWQKEKLPGFVNYMKKTRRPDFTYADFAAEFQAEFFNPEEWANIFKASGARYIVLTSKHHEGFTLWPSNYSWNWNAKDVGPKRDLVGDLLAAVRKTGIHGGLYHSLFEWFNPLYMRDKASQYSTQDYVVTKTIPELYELVERYKPDIVWSDGIDRANSTYWTSAKFVQWLYNESPVKDYVVTNDRWGTDTMCKHGGVFTCTDRYNPKTLQKRKFENAFSIDKSCWGYRRDVTLSTFLTIEDILDQLISTISCGGNVLIDIGPTAYGKIPPIFEERLRQLGSWLNVNGEGIYKTVPWGYQNDTVTPNVWYTVAKKNESKVYAIIQKWPTDGKLMLGSPKPTDKTAVSLLGYEGKIPWEKVEGGGMLLNIPAIHYSSMPCMWAWTFKLENVLS